MSTDAIRQLLEQAGARRFGEHDVPPFFGGTVAKFWPDPYGPEGTDAYTIGQANDAMTRAFLMLRNAIVRPATAGGYNSVQWAACDRQDLLLFACGSALAGMAIQLGELDGTRGASIPMQPDDLDYARDLLEVMAPATSLAWCRERFADVVSAATDSEINEPLTRMRKLALYCTSATAQLCTKIGVIAHCPPAMLADLCLATIPYAFPVTDSDAADHWESPDTDDSTGLGAVFVAPDPLAAEGSEAG